MLLYTGLVDSGQCCYLLGLLKNVLEAEPKAALLALASTGMASLQPPSGGYPFNFPLVGVSGLGKGGSLNRGISNEGSRG